MISDAAKAAFRQRANMPSAYNDFSPGTVRRFRSFAAAIGGSDPFAEPAPPGPFESVTPVALPVPAKPSPAVPAKSTAVDDEFERVRAAALARQADEDAAVAAMLDAMQAGDPSDRSSRLARATDDRGADAANLILSFLPPKGA